MPEAFIKDLASVIAGHAQQAIAQTGIPNALMQFEVCRSLAADLQFHKGTSHKVTAGTWHAVVDVWPEWSGWVATLTDEGIRVEIPAEA
jgi:hypothetical protein